MARRYKVPAEAFEGDYPDPDKSRKVDASYGADYLDRRDKMVEEMRGRMKKRAKPSRFVETGEGLKIVRRGENDEDDD